MANLKNITTTSVNSDKLPAGTTAQRPVSPETGMMRFNTSFNEVEFYNGTSWINPNTGSIAGLGQTSATAANSAEEILRAYPNSADGVYWINLPTDGAQQTYCLMDRRFDGGGWMMAMKATRGTTFQYGANYWTTNNTLNATTQLNRNDADAKFHVMNRFPAKDMLAVWPDVGQGGSIRGVGAFTMLQLNFYNERIATTTFFNTVDRWFIRDSRTYSGWDNNVFPTQTAVFYYGYNYFAATAGNGTRVRWGFGMNENAPLEVWPEGENTSDDCQGGIGMNYRDGTALYSAGAYTGGGGAVGGINRDARVELYVR
jgi:hypothetical protein